MAVRFRLRACVLALNVNVVVPRGWLMLFTGYVIVFICCYFLTYAFQFRFQSFIWIISTIFVTKFYIFTYIPIQIYAYVCLYTGGCFLEILPQLYHYLLSMVILYFRVFQIAIGFCIFICMWVQIYSHAYNILGLYYSIYLYVYEYKYTHMHTIYWGLYLSGNALTSGLLFLAFWFLIEYLAIN